MCKTNVKINLYFVDMCKHEHEKTMTLGYDARLCRRLVLNKLKKMKFQGHEKSQEQKLKEKSNKEQNNIM